VADIYTAFELAHHWLVLVLLGELGARAVEAGGKMGVIGAKYRCKGYQKQRP